MSSKNQPSGTTTSTSTTSPWSGQTPYLTGGNFGSDTWGPLPGTTASGQPAGITSNTGILGTLPSAAALYENYTPQYYPGQTYATPTTAQQNAISGMENLGAAGSPVTSTAASANNQFLTGANLANDPAMSTLAQMSGQNPTSANATALQGYASGAQAAAGNPYTSGEAQSVLSSVVPSIESQFIAGGDLSSPQAAYAASQGATAALAPTMFSNYTTEQQNQLNALGQQNTAANNLQNAYGQNEQQTLGSLALAPSTQQMPYTDLSQEYNAGATDQSNQQSAINSNVNEYNYNETLPYNMLNQYIGEVTGNYGGSSTLTQPFFSNAAGNTLGDAAAGASLGGSLLGSSGLGLMSTGAGSGVGAGLGALLALL